jgi:hypothetical protein
MRRETGFLDKNKKMICEGDLLEQLNHWDLKVVWDDKQKIFMGEVAHPNPEKRYRFTLDFIARMSQIKESN